MRKITFDEMPDAISDLVTKVEFLTEIVRNHIATPLPVLPSVDTLPMTVQQTAELAHLAVPTIYGLVGRREIPFTKKGKRLYFIREEILAWIKEGRRKTVAETAMDVKEELAAKSDRK